jgi:hypothetical protein
MGRKKMAGKEGPLMHVFTPGIKDYHPVGFKIKVNPPLENSAQE